MSRAWQAALAVLGVVGGGFWPAVAAVVTDGTVGAARSLAGPNYGVSADLGRQVGSNLFHSFSRFNLATGEAATFSGPSSVANVVGRVTGGTASSIDGTIRSTIPGANLFLINPAGMVFGPNAQLDVSGSFHASTADYLRFADGARFQVTNPAGSSFTAAPPAAFGFLTANPAGIALIGPQLGVPSGQALSLVGGPVALSGGAFVVAAAGGSINLIAAGSPGEVAIGAAGRAEAGAIERVADIALSGSSVFVQNGGPGAITIRAANLTVDSGAVNAFANNAASVPIDIRLTGDLALQNGGSIGSGQVIAGGTGTPGPISIRARSIRLVDGTILSTNFGAERGGDVALTAAEGIQITKTPGNDNLALVSATSGGDGRAGDVNIRAKNLELAGRGARITAQASLAGTGPGGNITIDVDQLILRDGADVAASSAGAGDAGNVSIAGRSLQMSGVAQISAITEGAGRGGSVEIVVDQMALGSDAGIVAASTSTATGDPGSISIAGRSLQMTGGGFVSTNTAGAGRGGTLTVRESDAVNISGSGETGSSGIFSRSRGTGQGGAISVNAGGVTVANGGIITAANTGSGDAGSIAITVGNLVVQNGGSISTEAATGGGGNIAIHAGQLVQLSNAQVTTSVGGGTGGGGNITIDPQFVVLNNGTIKANAVGGNGGNITITAGQFLATPSSIVEAKSERAINGTIVIQAPSTDVTRSLTQLSGKFFSAPSVRREGCAGPVRAERQPSSLVAGGRGGLPQDGEGAQPGTYFAGRDVKPSTKTSGKAERSTAKPPAIRITCSG